MEWNTNHINFSQECINGGHCVEKELLAGKAGNTQEKTKRYITCYNPIISKTT